MQRRISERRISERRRSGESGGVVGKAVMGIRLAKLAAQQGAAQVGNRGRQLVDPTNGHGTESQRMCTKSCGLRSLPPEKTMMA